MDKLCGADFLFASAVGYHEVPAGPRLFAPAATGAHIFHGCTTRRWTRRETIVTTSITVPAGRIQTFFSCTGTGPPGEAKRIRPGRWPVSLDQSWPGLGRIDGLCGFGGCLAVDNWWLRGNLGAVGVSKIRLSMVGWSELYSFLGTRFGARRLCKRMNGSRAKKRLDSIILRPAVDDCIAILYGC